MRLALAALCVVVGGACVSSQASDVGDVFRIEPLGGGVYAAIVLPQPDAYAFANSLVVVGERGVLVVDTQQSPRAARALIREIEALTDLPVRWIVNTHWHGDHVYGNSAYRARWPAVEIMATPATVEGMRGPGAEMRADELASLPGAIEEREDWLEAGALPDGRALDEGLRAQVEYSLRMRRIYLEELSSLEVVYPTTLVAVPTQLDLGGRSVALLPVGPAHTSGDLAVFLEKEGILAAGDLVEEGLPWLEGAELSGWASALERLAALDARAVLAAHAGGVLGREILDGETALLRDLSDGVASAARGELDAGRLAERLEEHRAFLGELGVSAEAFDRWVEGVGSRVPVR